MECRNRRTEGKKIWEYGGHSKKVDDQINHELSFHFEVVASS